MPGPTKPGPGMSWLDFAFEVASRAAKSCMRNIGRAGMDSHRPRHHRDVWRDRRRHRQGRHGGRCWVWRAGLRSRRSSRPSGRASPRIIPIRWRIFRTSCGRWRSRKRGGSMRPTKRRCASSDGRNNLEGTSLLPSRISGRPHGLAWMFDIGRWGRGPQSSTRRSKISGSACLSSPVTNG